MFDLRFFGTFCLLLLLKFDVSVNSQVLIVKNFYLKALAPRLELLTAFFFCMSRLSTCFWIDNRLLHSLFLLFFIKFVKLVGQFYVRNALNGFLGLKLLIHLINLIITPCLRGNRMRRHWLDCHGARSQINKAWWIVWNRRSCSILVRDFFFHARQAFIVWKPTIIRCAFLLMFEKLLLKDHV